MRMRILATVAVLAAFAGLGAVGTLAVFTDQETNGLNEFTAGTIELTQSPSSALVTFSNMLPGDSVTSPLVLSNAAGSSALRYAISAAATNGDAIALKDTLVLQIKTIDVTEPETPCNNFDGAGLYAGDLDSTAGKLVGDSTPGQHSGDRTLAATASETLCFRVSLPDTTGNSYKLATTTATFTFDAEQTKNNP